MQALKKAEQTKQKQNELSVDDELTLSPKETPDLLEKTDSGSSASGLATSDEKANAYVFSDTIPASIEEISSESIAIPPLPASQHHESRQDATRPHGFDAPSPPQKPVDDTEDEVNTSGGNADLPDAGAQKFARPDLAKKVTEERQAADERMKQLMAEQQKAKSVFSSKTPERKRSKLVIGVVATGCLLSLLGAAYVYWQINDTGITGKLAVTSPITPKIQAQPQVPAQVPPQAATVPDADADSASKAKQLADAGLNLDKPVPKEDATTQQAILPPSKPGPADMAADASAKQLGSDKNTVLASKAKTESARSSTSANENNAIHIRQSSSENKINPTLDSAYQAYITGNSALAKQEYNKVILHEPNNRDALLGLAAIALNQRQAEQAGFFYGKILDLNPGDPDAIAGLTSLQQGDPVQSESRLKKALSQNPQSGAILFALGNLYANQSRWSDAQQTFFRAYVSTPNSADYAFNLAISLDRLNQVKLAIEYYQRALKLVENSAGNFNRNDVKQRIKDLENIAEE
ncbi:tetratricopeptide repeat protein [Undibacterium sp. Ji50W]|uniref:tetratricopeptide repeat protein n=1 Tax=Undibacterium sp. Ji50W TaxID=3413041 RepID=UPI003BF1BFBE